MSEVEVKHKVIKSWVNTANISHPQEIRAQIFKNDELFEEIRLSSSENWAYEWTALDSPDVVWSVKELDVPQNYTVSYSALTNTEPASELGTNPRSVFIITNKSREGSVPDNPDSGNVVPGKKTVNDIINWVQTGDVSSIALLTTLLSGSGVIILLLGLKRKIYSDKSGADTSDKK